MKQVIAALLLISVALATWAQDGMDAAQNARYQALIEELRCLVCQNQNIAESNAELAVDLRRQVREQILAGESDDQIRRYLQARYGDFVLYKPPVTGKTVVLWAGPFVLLGLVLIALFLVLRRRDHQPSASTQVDHQALDSLISRAERQPESKQHKTDTTP